MAIRKIHQSKLEAKRTSFHLNQLLSEGIDIGMDPEPGAMPEACPLEVTNSDIGEIYALPNDNTIYCLPLRIAPTPAASWTNVISGAHGTRLASNFLT
jgi:hypothetical protein